MLSPAEEAARAERTLQAAGANTLSPGRGMAPGEGELDHEANHQSFLAHSAETHELFGRVFDGLADPIDAFYSSMNKVRRPNPLLRHLTFQ